MHLKWFETIRRKSNNIGVFSYLVLNIDLVLYNSRIQKRERKKKKNGIFYNSMLNIVLKNLLKAKKSSKPNISTANLMANGLRPK